MTTGRPGSPRPGWSSDEPPAGGPPREDAMTRFVPGPAAGGLRMA